MQTDFSFANDLYLCIDQGGHASRAIIFNNHGEMIAQSEHKISIQHTVQGYVEHPANELLQSIRESIIDVIQQSGDQAPHIKAAGLATQRSNVCCWDKQTGEALSPVISWQDVREHEWLESLKPMAESIHRTTGLFLSPHYGAGKLRWCLNNIPEVQTALTENRLAFGPMASFILFNLLEQNPYLADPGNASRTQLWSLQNKTWDTEMLALFDIPEQILPECVASKYAFGNIKLAGQSIPLTICTGDQSAAMFAYGRIQPETAYINTGTGAFVSRPSGYAKRYARRLLTSVIYQDDKNACYVLEGTINGAGSAMDYIASELNIENIFAPLESYLERTKTGHDEHFKQLFINGVSGLGAPFWIPDFPIRFTQQSEDWEKIVAVVESVIFLMQENIHEMKKFASPPGQIQITGGMSIQNEICQRLADLTQLPVYRPIECEATARGLAYLLTNQPDSWPETEPGDWFKPSNNSGLQRRYEAWHEVMVALMRT